VRLGQGGSLAPPVPHRWWHLLPVPCQGWHSPGMPGEGAGVGQWEQSPWWKGMMAQPELHRPGVCPPSWRLFVHPPPQGVSVALLDPGSVNRDAGMQGGGRKRSLV